MTPGSVELDPRSDDTQEDIVAPAPASLRPEAETITPRAAASETEAGAEEAQKDVQV